MPRSCPFFGKIMDIFVTTFDLKREVGTSLIGTYMENADFLQFKNKK